MGWSTSTGIKEAEQVPKSFLPAAALGYGAYKGAVAVKNAVTGGSAMTQVERAQEERKNGPATPQDVAAEDERWAALIGSDDPADVETAIRSNGEAQGMSTDQIEAQVRDYRKRRGLGQP